MGIFQFFLYLIDKGVNAPIGDDYDQIFIDLNSAIHHEAAEKTGAGEKDVNKKSRILTKYRKEPEMLKADIFEGVLNYIVEMNRLFSPSKTVYVAVDGVPVMAKINQQKQRAYRSTLSEPNPIWDSSVIKPGTEFMQELDAYLREHLPIRVKVPNLVYSSHLVPGEGEHKIMDALRSGKYNTLKKTAIIGVDNDMLVLALTLGRDRLFIYSYKDRMGRIREHTISIDRVRTAMLDGMNLLDATKKPKVDINGPNIFDDLTALFALIPNDFLPSMPGFYVTTNSLPALLEAYGKFQGFDDPKASRRYITTNGELVYANFHEFLKVLITKERTLLRRLRIDDRFTDIEALVKSTAVERVGAKINVELRINEFKDEWWKRFGNGIRKEVTQSLKNKVMQDFLNGVHWFVHYYKGQQINLNWFYPHFFSPPLSDLVNYNYVENEDWLRREASFTPLLQMLAITPPRSFERLPEAARELLETGPLADLCPEEFKIIKQGAMADSGNEAEQIIPVIPPVSPYRIIFEASKVKWSKTLLRETAPVNEVSWESEVSGRFRGRGRGRGERGGRGGKDEGSRRGTGKSPGQGEGPDDSSRRGRGGGFRGERGRGSRGGRGARGSRGRGERGTFRGRGRGDRGN